MVMSLDVLLIGPSTSWVRLHGKVGDFVEQLQHIYKPTHEYEQAVKYKQVAEIKWWNVEFEVGDFI